MVTPIGFEVAFLPSKEGDAKVVDVLEKCGLKYSIVLDDKLTHKFMVLVCSVDEILKVVSELKNC